MAVWEADAVAGKLIRPFETTAGSSAASTGAANKARETARARNSIGVLAWIPASAGMTC